MGGVDTVLNHEVLARLTQRAEARPELGLHVLREAIWASLFFGLAWFEWHGAAALVIVALVAAEIAITACDEFVANRIRVLPQNERVLHLFLALNVGLVAAALVPLVFAWAGEPTGSCAATTASPPGRSARSRPRPRSGRCAIFSPGAGCVRIAAGGFK